MLTFDEFYNTKEQMTIMRAARALKEDADFLAGPDTIFIWIFNNSFWIQQNIVEDDPDTGPLDDTYWVLIEREETAHKTLVDAARRLYVEFYVTEVVGPPNHTLEGLSSALKAFCELNGFDYAEAEEVLTAALGCKEHSDWLQWFIQAWENACEHEPSSSPVATGFGLAPLKTEGDLHYPANPDGTATIDDIRSHLEAIKAHAGRIDLLAGAIEDFLVKRSI